MPHKAPPSGGDPSPPAAEAEAYRGARHQDRLKIVMVDPARREEIVHDGHLPGHEDGQAAGERAEQPPTAPADQAGIDEEQKRRPERHHGLLRPFRAEKRRQAGNPGCKRQVDQPRPVHGHAFRRQVAILRQVEPALPCEKIAHRDQPHHVVAVGQSEPECLGDDLGLLQKEDAQPEESENAGKQPARAQATGGLAVVTNRGGRGRDRQTASDASG